MPLHDSEAFVLRTFSLKEADKICVFFTRDAGKLRGVAHGARKLRSRFGASLEPFTEVSLTYFQKENKELVSVSNCEILRSQFFEGISSEQVGVMQYLAELIDSFLLDHEPNETVYRLIAATLETMQQVQSSELMTLARYFEIWMLKLAGFFPEWRRCGLCDKDLSTEPAVYLTNEGMPQCAACSGQRGEELRPPVWRAIQEILTQSPNKFLSLAREPRLLAQVGGIATRLIVRALEREPRSYEVLSRLRPAL
ncbi:MAG: DNA repair protein RecO [Acidobacteria bacterium]|nr:DNA repair protein RecO [Acidobacteriota bacterium]